MEQSTSDNDDPKPEQAPTVQAFLPGTTGNISPVKAILLRLLLALAMITFVALVCFIGRDGYSDADGGPITGLDAFYYASVSVTTTGYGDITPITKSARLATILLVTPARIVFLILLVGTTVEFLASASRNSIRWWLMKRKLENHIVIFGFGIKGESAFESLLNSGHDPDKIIIIDPSKESVRKAAHLGVTAIQGEANDPDVLEQVNITKASAAIVAVHRDDTAIMAVLNLRRICPNIRIIAACREEESEPLLRQGGAEIVLVSSGATGRLLGLAADMPENVRLLEELLHPELGMSIADRPATKDDVGPLSQMSARPHEIILAVLRDGEILRRNEWPREFALEPSDHLIYLKLNNKN